MVHDLIKKLNTARFKSIVNIVLFVMLILFLIFVLFRAEKINAQVCSDEDCGACLNSETCWATDYCFWNLPLGPCISFIEYDYVIRYFEDFEQPAYNIGYLNGQNDWISTFTTVSSNSYNGDQAINVHRELTSDSAFKTYFSKIYGKGFFDFYFSINEYPNSPAGIEVLLRSDATTIAHCKITGVADQETFLYCNAGDFSGTYYFVADVSLFAWNKITIEFDPDIDKIRWRYANYDFYDWVDTFNDFDYINQVYFSNATQIGLFFGIDDIRLGSFVCSNENCAGCNTAGDCLLAGCYFDYMSGDCLTIGAGICGQNAGLQFCDNQVDCEFFGGNWVADYCFWGEQPPTITPFIEYYASNSNFDIPTGFIQSLADFITPIIETTGGFLTSFKDIFDPAVATEKGMLFGSAIPLMIGYTGIINDFLGGLPVAEGLLAFIIVVLLISVFRIVVKLIHIIKP